MLDVQAYNDYLTKKLRNTAQIQERLDLCSELQELLKNATENEVDSFVQRQRNTAKQKAFEFLADYVAFIEKEVPNLLHVSTVINDYCTRTFENAARGVASKRRTAIYPIPADTQIARKHLGELSNAHFIDAFSALQKTLIKMYENIEQRPYEWGYPNFYVTDGYNNRMADILFAFVLCGEHQNGVLTVDAKKFFNMTKSHKKVELAINGLNRMGFAFEGFNKKADTFQVAYSENPHVITVLQIYIKEVIDVHPQWGVNPRNSFSYRFIQDVSTQNYEAEFLAAMDTASEKLREIQFWLHAEAIKYGFYIDKKTPMSGYGVLYKKNTKEFLSVGEREINGEIVVFSRAVFKDALYSEKEIVSKLYKKFPRTFKESCSHCKNGNCEHQIVYYVDGNMCYGCRSNGFWFNDVSLDDVKVILDFYKLDKKIKPV